MKSAKHTNVFAKQRVSEAVPGKPDADTASYSDLRHRIKSLGKASGFDDVGISSIELTTDESRLNRWLADGFHGEMHYMRRHGTKRSRPSELVPGTLTIISARMNYMYESGEAVRVLADPTAGYIARYALGRDYHKVMRSRLKLLAENIRQHLSPLGYRVFCDSAPVLEKALARNAGLGWIGKHTNLINRDAGSWFFLGEIYTDAPLMQQEGQSPNLCGSCNTCIQVCPTQAIVAPYRLDARRCIAYLTIELHGSIPVEFRHLLGNRIFGCDDCQLFCPWNRHAQLAVEPDFAARHGLNATSLLELFAWSEAEFLARSEGSALRRVGYERWLRNIAVALGNAPYSETVIKALEARMSDAGEIVHEHISWALEQQLKKRRN